VKLPWIRLDTAMFDNPKVLDLTEDGDHRAVVLHLTSMCFAGAHGTSGHVPRNVLRRLGGTRADAVKLVKAGLWEMDADGYRIHDWDEYQMSDQESKGRRMRAKKGGCVKNHGPACGCWQYEEPS